MAKVGDIFQVFINTVTSETIAGHQCIAAYQLEIVGPPSE
jgi:hypothetical protein